jgi:hypothetical protein
MAAALVSFEAVGSGFVPSLLVENPQSRFIVEDNPAWGKRNALIVLGDGTVHFPDQPIVRPAVLAYSRIVQAVRLYVSAKRNHRPCSIVISGGDASRTGVTEAENYRAEMLRLGVEDSDIVPEGRSLNTSGSCGITFTTCLVGTHLDSFWIPLNFSLFSPRDHRVGTMRVVFLAWTPGKRWPDRAYPEDLGRGWFLGKCLTRIVGGAIINASVVVIPIPGIAVACNKDSGP